MFTVERLQHKISPLEDKEFTDKVLPRLKKAAKGKKMDPHQRHYKGVLCVVLSPREAWELLFPEESEPNLHELTVLGRSLQALLWERSYLKGLLVFSKPLEEIGNDGF